MPTGKSGLQPSRPAAGLLRAFGPRNQSQLKVKLERRVESLLCYGEAFLVHAKDHKPPARQARAGHRRREAFQATLRVEQPSQVREPRGHATP